jgi:SAM-dependent methyltransferase
MTDLDNRRLDNEARFQDERMKSAQRGERELRDRFYFINQQAYDEYVRLLSGLAGKRVVVVGSSDGGVTPLGRQQAYVEGIDISPVAIAELQKAIEKERLSQYASARVMNAEALAYADRSIDVISCSGVLHHLNTERALQSWSRCLKSDGRVILFEPLALHPVAAVFRWLTPKLRTPDEHPLRGRDFALMRHYFSVVEPRFFGLTTVVCAGVALLPGGTRVAEKMLGSLEALDAWLLATLPFLRQFCWLTVVQLRAPKAADSAPAA